MSTDLERVQRWALDGQLVTDDVHAGRVMGYVVCGWADSRVMVAATELGRPSRWLPLWRTREVGLKPSTEAAS